jgi:stringent starvation protein B
MEFAENYPVKIVLIFRSFDKTKSNLLLYSTVDAKTNNTWVQEMAVLRNTHEDISIKVQQLLPIHSREEGHKWLIQKDEHRYLSFILAVDSLVEEVQILELRKRVCREIREQEELLLSQNPLLKVTLFGD